MRETDARHAHAAHGRFRSFVRFVRIRGRWRSAGPDRSARRSLVKSQRIAGLVPQKPFAKLSLPMILRTFVRTPGQAAAVRVSIAAASGRTRDASAAIQFA